MIASFLFVFLVTCFGTVFNLMLFGWIASRLLSERESKIAVFAFLLGGVILGGQFFGMRLRTPLQVEDVASLIGALIGVAFVWAQFFLKDRQHG